MSQASRLFKACEQHLLWHIASIHPRSRDEGWMDLMHHSSIVTQRFSGLWQVVSFQSTVRVQFPSQQMLKKMHDIELLICRMFSALILLLPWFPANVFGSGMSHMLSRPLHWP